MLNRIYIIVGMLAIIVLAGAFIAPNFVRWSDYRGRMEALATSVLGTPVTVRGDISFSLLPQPKLHFTNVLVGSPEEPAATVDGVEAEFSLMDFLRDHYTVTRLVLRQPVIDFTIDESGFLGSGVTLAAGTGGVGLGDTTIVDATVRLMDRRSGETFEADTVSGELRLSSFSGPFAFQGSGRYHSQPFNLRFNSGTIDDAGKSRVSLFLQPQSGAFSFSLEGLLAPGMAPKFEGDMVYRQTPPTADVATDIRGDLLLESKVTGSTDRIVLTGYTLRPDENRAGTRLTGAASIQLGDVRSFDAVISGGVFSLPPRDATEDAATLPYELVRLLAELPAPVMPPMAGRVGIDLAEVGLRGFALRNVRMDAHTDGAGWQIDQFIGELPGDTNVVASGLLTADNDRPTFRGEISIDSARLNGLAALWRKPDADNNLLFNEPGTLTGQVMLAGDAFGLVNGVLTLNQHTHNLEIRLGFGEEKRLDLVAHFDDLGERGSALVGALLPNIAAEPAFGVSFPFGSFSVTAKTARILGLDGTGLVAEGQWRSEAVSFSRISAGDWGGIGFEASMAAAGTAAQPDVSGSGSVRVDAGDAPALVGLYDLLDLPVSWRDFLALSAPADLTVELGELAEGAQTLSLAGSLGAGVLNLEAELGGGIAALAEAPLRVTGGLESTDIAGLTRQLGLGDTGLFSGEGSMLVNLQLEGSPSNSLDASLTASLAEQNVSFAGNLLSLDNGEIQGTGTLDVSLGDAGALAGAIGADGLTLPPATGSAQLHFEGGRLIRLTDIAGRSGPTGFAGELSLSHAGGMPVINGDIAVDLVSVEELSAALFGSAGLVGGDMWPEGPIDLAAEPRQTRGTVNVTAAALAAGGVERLGKTSFELSWDETRTRLARLTAVADLGTVNLDIAVCCAGPLVDKTISGRMSIATTPLDLIAPAAIADMIDGLVDGGVQFEGTGASLAEVAATMSGEGNFTLTDLTVEKLSPDVYPTVAGLNDVLTMEADAMGAVMGLALERGPFTAPAATGAFTIAGGVVRVANVIIDGVGARLTGDVNLVLPDLGLSGGFAMTPRDFADTSGLIGADTARVITRLAGTLLEPVVTLDLEEMIAAVLVRANEIEVDRLEVLRAEDAERQRAAAEERNRLIEEQRRRAAEEAARLAAEEAARLAAEEEARRLEQQQAPQTSPSIQTLPNEPVQEPLDLGLPPVNRPFGPAANQPLF